MVHASATSGGMATYTAGTTGGVDNVVVATDMLGNVAMATIHVSLPEAGRPTAVPLAMGLHPWTRRRRPQHPPTLRQMWGRVGRPGGRGFLPRTSGSSAAANEQRRRVRLPCCREAWPCRTRRRPTVLAALAGRRRPENRSLGAGDTVRGPSPLALARLIGPEYHRGRGPRSGGCSPWRRDRHRPRLT